MPEESQRDAEREASTPARDGAGSRHTFTRLLVGAAAVGLDALLKGLQTWEEKLEPPGEVAEGERAGAENAPPASSEPQTEAPGQESQPGRLRYALVGLLFEAQDRLSAGLSGVASLGKAASGLVAPLLRAAQESQLLAPIRQRFDALAERGEQELEGLVERGRQEAGYSQELAEVAVKTTVDQSIRYLAHNEELEELIETQSTGLIYEVLEEVRERAVSADSLVEGVVRKTLRRPPRYRLPAPPDEVMARAAGFHAPPKKRALKR